MTITAESFKETMGCFATGVTIVTTAPHESSTSGLTINSFNSVSLQPPLILFSIDNQCSEYEAFFRSQFFCVNILSEEQRSISRDFAHPPIQNWSNYSSKSDDAGCPIIEGGHAYFSCTKEHLYDGGDHSIFLCKVVSSEIDHAKRPLLYYQGQYQTLSSKV